MPPTDDVVVDDGFGAVHIHVARSCDESGEDQFITEIAGSIVWTQLETADERQAGSISAYLFDFARAQDAGYCLFDLLDVHSCSSIYADLLVGPNLRLSRKFVNFSNSAASRLLVLDQVEVLPPYRGMGLALTATTRLLQVLRGPDVLTVVQPWPYQFNEDHREKAERLALGTFEPDRKKALRRLGRYWGKLGFRKIVKHGDRELWGLAPFDEIEPVSSLVT